MKNSTRWRIRHYWPLALSVLIVPKTFAIDGFLAGLISLCLFAFILVALHDAEIQYRLGYHIGMKHMADAHARAAEARRHGKHCDTWRTRPHPWQATS